jgi:hypothetical protein
MINHCTHNPYVFLNGLKIDFEGATFYNVG